MVFPADQTKSLTRKVFSCFTSRRYGMLTTAVLLLGLLAPARLHEPVQDVALMSGLVSTKYTCTELNTTMCKRPCNETEGQECLTFSSPLQSCWNPRVLFPNSTVWGNYDISEELSASGTQLRTTLYGSTNQSCSQQAFESYWPLDTCTGPVSDSHPFGIFSCENKVAVHTPVTVSDTADPSPAVSVSKSSVKSYSKASTSDASSSASAGELCHFGDPFQQVRCKCVSFCCYSRLSRSNCGISVMLHVRSFVSSTS